MATGTYRLPAQPRYRPTGTLRRGVSSSMRKMAAEMREKHPDLGAHENIRDAANALDRNQHEAAIRHLNAAIGHMQPLSLRRHGLLTDDQHDAAKRSMASIHRHLLLVKDIQDMHEANQQLPRRGDAPEDDEETPAVPQPDSDRTPGTPARETAARIDISVAKPQQQPGPKQVAASNTGRAVELAGPKGYVHGWRFVGTPGTPEHAAALRRLADKMDSTHRTAASGHVRQAASAIDRGDLNAAGESLNRAYMQRRSDTGESRARGGRSAAQPEAAETDELNRHLGMISGALDQRERAALPPAHGIGGKLKRYYQTHASEEDGIELAFNPRQPRDARGRWSREAIRAALPAADRALVQATRAEQADVAAKTLPGGLGTHAHAEELRQLGREAELRTARNVFSASGVQEGTAPRALSRMAGGISAQAVSPDNPGARALRRAADMIDRRQLSLARVHADTIREQASAEAYGDPLFAARLRAAADKLEQLPTKQGLAAQPPMIPQYATRTVQARRYAAGGRSTIQAANSYDFSAKTGALAVTPHPLGRPGGPGLWHVKGMELPPYIQNIAHALLRTGRAKTVSQAIAMAKGATNRWSRGGGHVHPEVRAASAGANAQWEAKRARAHAHANPMNLAREPYHREPDETVECPYCHKYNSADALYCDQCGRKLPDSAFSMAVEMSGTAAGAAKDPRVPPGQPGGGRFGSGQGQQKPMDAHQKHVAHLQHLARTRAGRQQLIAQDRQKLAGLEKQRSSLLKAIASAKASASGKTSKGQAGATTSAKGSVTASNAPAAKSTATAAKKTATAAKKLTPAQQLAAVDQQITTLRAQIKQLSSMR